MQTCMSTFSSHPAQMAIVRLLLDYRVDVVPGIAALATTYRKPNNAFVAMLLSRDTVSAYMQPISTPGRRTKRILFEQLLRRAPQPTLQQWYSDVALGLAGLLFPLHVVVDIADWCIAPDKVVQALSLHAKVAVVERVRRAFEQRKAASQVY